MCSFADALSLLVTRGIGSGRRRGRSASLNKLIQYPHGECKSRFLRCRETVKNPEAKADTCRSSEEAQPCARLYTHGPVWMRVDGTVIVDDVGDQSTSV